MAIRQFASFLLPFLIAILRGVAPYSFSMETGAPPCQRCSRRSESHWLLLVTAQWMMVSPKLSTPLKFSPDRHSLITSFWLFDCTACIMCIQNCDMVILKSIIRFLKSFPFEVFFNIRHFVYQTCFKISLTLHISHDKSLGSFSILSSSCLRFFLCLSSAFHCFLLWAEKIQGYFGILVEIDVNISRREK